MTPSNYMQRIVERALSQPRKEKVCQPQIQEQECDEEVSMWMKRAETIEKQMGYLRTYGRHKQAEQAEKLLIYVRSRIREMSIDESNGKEAPAESD